MVKLFWVTLTYLLFTCHAQATDWHAELIVSGLKVPWGLTQMSENEIIVSERSGQVGVLKLKEKTYQALFQVKDVYPIGQGGLLDVAASPFESDTLYFTYSVEKNDAFETALAKATYRKQQLSEWQPLLVTRSGSDGGRHFGSRITFDESSLYLSIGDRGERDNGQDLSTHAGSILRVNYDGSVPQDNPFIGTKNARSEIWSYGHRNPQGLFFDSLTERLWSSEHGPRGGDEINLIKKGANYGWPITSHGKEYWGPISVGEAKEKEGIESPKKVYIPSIAPGSLILYRGNKYPSLNGKLLAGALKLTHINVLTLDGERVVNEERILESLGERVRDIEALNDGTIIFSTDSGKIYRLLPITAIK